MATGNGKLTDNSQCSLTFIFISFFEDSTISNKTNVSDWRNFSGVWSGKLFVDNVDNLVDNWIIRIFWAFFRWIIPGTYPPENHSIFQSGKKTGKKISKMHKYRSFSNCNLFVIFRNLIVIVWYQGSKVNFTICLHNREELTLEPATTWGSSGD